MVNFTLPDPEEDAEEDLEEDAEEDPEVDPEEDPKENEIVTSQAKQVVARVTKEKNDAESALKEKASALADTERHLQLAETRLEELRVKPAEWQRELRQINQQMAGKCPA